MNIKLYFNNLTQNYELYDITEDPRHGEIKRHLASYTTKAEARKVKKALEKDGTVLKEIQSEDA